MKLNRIALLFLVGLAFAACKNGTSENGTGNVENDTTIVVEQAAPDLVGDSVLTNTAKYYADMVSDEQARKTLNAVDTLITKDMQDLREKCNFVFYPFSGPDFLYPHVMFPDADTYLMLGLEKTGSLLNTIEKDAERVSKYKNAMSVYLRSSFFITTSMQSDLGNSTVDGTIPIISMLITKEDCQIISVKYKELADSVTMVDSETQSNIVEIKFFSNKTPKHEQTIYYVSADASNKSYSEKVQPLFEKMLTGKNVVTFVKAASYIMHHDHFSNIRQNVKDYSFAILQDDSGMPYREMKDMFDVTLYGTYKHPLRVFAEMVNQPDLDALYREPGVRPLNFRIGYNSPSNWQCARKK